MSGFYDDTDDKEQDSTVKKMVVGAVCTASVVFLVFLICMYMGTRPKNLANKTTEESATAESNSQEDDFKLSKSGLKSSDLDFWNMFGNSKSSDDFVPSQDSDESEGKPAVFTEQGVKPDKIGNNNSDDRNPDAKWVNGDPNDGTHIAITDADGNKTWYEILDIAKSPYTANYIKNIPSGMVQYDDGTIKSKFGADISSDQGTFDMSSVKPNGVDFVMIRAYIRDKSTGIVTEDPLYSTNVINAVNEGINVGISVDSQALTDTEATEEANYAIVAATNAGIKYPIAINIPDLSDSSNRMSKLSNEQRTAVIKTFCERVKSYNFKPLIHANKNDLITKINVEDLAEYDVWVNDIGKNDVPNTQYFTDYPYKFTMWQYQKGTNLCGLVGGASLDVSFVSYEQN